MKTLLAVLLISFLTCNLAYSVPIRDSVGAGINDGDSTDLGFDNAGPTMELGDDATPVNAQTYLRFPDVQIPNGATINSAIISVFANDAYTSTLNTKIYAVDADDQAAFSQASDFALTKTSASVDWDPGDWVAFTFYSTSDISTVVKEIVDRGGWNTGNAIVLLILNAASAGTTTRRIRSFDLGGTIESSKLIVDYTAAAAGAGWAGQVVRVIQ